MSSPEYLNWLLDRSLEFWLSVAFGCFVIFLFAFNEFNKPSIERNHLKPETIFSPSELTTQREYIFSFVFYLLMLEIVYLVISLIGPGPFAHVLTGVPDVAAAPSPTADKETTSEFLKSFPLWVALIMIGVLPKVPFFEFIEQSLRRLAHRSASIPDVAVSLAHEIRRAEINWKELHKKIESKSEKYDEVVIPEDLEAEDRTLEHRWARLSSLMSLLSDMEANSAFYEFLDVDFLKRYPSELDAIRHSYIQVADKVVETRRENSSRRSANNGVDLPEGLGEMVDPLLERVCVFLACTILTKNQSRAEISKALVNLGMIPRSPIQKSTEMDVLVLSSAFSFGSCLLLLLIAPIINNIIDTEIHFPGWPTRENDAINVILTMASLILMYIPALLISLIMRRYWISSQTWYGGTIKSPELPKGTKYLVIFFVIYFCTLISMSYFDGAVRGSEKMIEGIKQNYPRYFISASVIIFVCSILDSYKTGSNYVQLKKLAVYNTFIATILALIASIHYHDLSQTGAIAFSVIATGLFSGILGFTLANRLHVKKINKKGKNRTPKTD